MLRSAKSSTMAPTGCPADTLCMVPAICLPTSLGFYDQVPVGAECTLDDYYYCGNVDGRLTGVCDDAPIRGQRAALLRLVPAFRGQRRL